MCLVDRLLAHRVHSRCVSAAETGTSVPRQESALALGRVASRRKRPSTAPPQECLGGTGRLAEAVRVCTLE